MESFTVSLSRILLPLTRLNTAILTPGNFKFGGGFKWDKLKYYDGEMPSDFILKNGDLIVTMTDLSKLGDTLGYPALVPPSKDLKFLHNRP